MTGEQYDNKVVAVLYGDNPDTRSVTLKKQLRCLPRSPQHLKMPTIVKEAKAAIKEYIDFYNHERMHQALGYRTPSLLYYKQKVA